MKEKRIHKVILKVAIMTFSMGVVISVIVTSIVFSIIHLSNNYELEGTRGTGDNSNYVNEMEIDGTPNSLSDNEYEESNNQNRGMSIEIVPEILAGGIITNLLASNNEQWYLKLVNSEHYVEPEFRPILGEIVQGHFVDQRIVTYTLEMLEAARGEGFNLIIASSYRSYEDQIVIFNNVMNQWMIDGLSPYEAYRATRETVALPGHSEHALGLALDIVSLNNQNLDESQSLTLENIWLRENSWRFGFILRYLPDKIHITGIIYEPWHFRFVGTEVARYMWENNLVLEEYLLERNLLRR